MSEIGCRSIGALAVALALAAGCERQERSGPVLSAIDAAEVAQRELRSANLDEEIVAVDRAEDAWVVTTRWRETSAAGHIVTVDAASGKVTVERYRTIQLDKPR